MRLSAVVAAALAAVVGLADCADTEQNQASSSANGPAIAVPLDITGQLVDGSRFDGAALAGKDVVLWFWAPRCGECRREAPHVAAVQRAAGDRAIFAGVAGRR